MCLETTKEETNKFRNRNKDKKFIWAYKVYERVGSGLYSPFCCHFNGIIPGIVKSDRSRLSFDFRNKDYYVGNGLWEITRGIHVYLTKKAALKILGHNINRIVLKVKCPMSEFVACNKKAAVFRAINLSQKEYDAAISKEIN